MAKKGLSKLVTADYSFDGTKVSYTNPVNNEKMAEYSVDIKVSDPNDLYLDNGVAETDGGEFVSGTLNLTTGDLSNETSKAFYHLKEEEITYAKGKTAKEYVWDDSMQFAEKGVGIIEEHQVNNETFYRGIWFARVKFNIPSDSATTRGQNIDWKTQELTGAMLRSQDAGHRWKSHADFETEAEALEYLMFKGGKAVETTEAGEA